MASKHLSEASKLLQEAGFSEHSTLISNIRETAGTVLLQVQIEETRGNLTKGQKLAIAMNAAFGDLR